MNYVAFGKTDFRISSIALGCQRIATKFRQSYRREAEATLPEAFEIGINLFDTADRYDLGASERMLGQAFARDRDKIIICSKAGMTFGASHHIRRWIKPLAKPILERSTSAAQAAATIGRGFDKKNFDREYIRRAIEASLRRLGTDFLDIFLLHCPPVSVLSDEGLFDTLEELKNEEKIRYYGISCTSHVTPTDAVAFAQREGISVLQITVNVMNTAVFKARKPVVAERQLAVMAREPFAGGEIFRNPELLAKLSEVSDRDTAQVAMQFVTQLTGDSVVLAGISSRTHLRECVKGYTDARAQNQSELARSTH